MDEGDLGTVATAQSTRASWFQISESLTEGVSLFFSATYHRADGIALPRIIHTYTYRDALNDRVAKQVSDSLYSSSMWN